MITSNIYKSVRSGVRVLRVLAELNSMRSGTVLGIARGCGLSRTTVYRFLETLVREGYVIRDDYDGHYRPTVMVRGLSDGFDDNVWLAQVGHGALMAAGEEVAWPIALSVPAGKSIAVISCTDSTSRFALDKKSPGHRRPFLQSASGLCYLAFCQSTYQGQLLDSLCRGESGDLDPDQHRDIEQKILEIRRLGFALYHRPGRRSDRSSLAVPVLVGDAPIGALVVRYARSAISDRAALRTFLEPLSRASSNIQIAFVAAQERHAGVMPNTIQ